MRGIEDWGDCVFFLVVCGLYIPCIFMYIIKNIFCILERKCSYSYFDYAGHADGVTAHVCYT